MGHVGESRRRPHINFGPGYGSGLGGETLEGTGRSPARGMSCWAITHTPLRWRAPGGPCREMGLYDHATRRGDGSASPRG